MDNHQPNPLSEMANQIMIAISLLERNSEDPIQRHAYNHLQQAMMHWVKTALHIRHLELQLQTMKMERDATIQAIQDITEAIESPSELMNEPVIHEGDVIEAEFLNDGDLIQELREAIQRCQQQ